MSHDECGKVVHRPCSSCINSIQELNKNSIKFSLLTWLRSRIKCLLLSLTSWMNWSTWDFINRSK